MADIQINIVEENPISIEIVQENVSVPVTMVGQGPKGEKGNTGAASTVPGPQGNDGNEVELRVDSGYIEWKYDDDVSWTQLIALTELKGDQGEAGEEVELRVSGGYIQWQYVGADDWQNLVEVATLKGDTGDTGAPGEDGEDAFVYIAYASADDGTGFTMTFNSSLNYIAVLSTDTEIVTPEASDFAGLWKNYKGEKGDQGDPGTAEIPGGTENNLVSINSSEQLQDSGLSASDFAPALGADDNYVTDAEKANLHAPGSDNQTLPTRDSLGLDTDDTVTFGNLSGTNTGDQDLSSYATKTGAEILSNKQVLVTAVPSSDHAATDRTIILTANENQAFGDVCYINGDGEAQLGDADAIATSKIVCMAIETITANNPGTYLLYGVARDDSWNWTVGGHIYLSLTGTTGNTLTQTAPSATDDCIVVIGVALHADRMLFNPSPSIAEVV